MVIFTTFTNVSELCTTITISLNLTLTTSLPFPVSIYLTLWWPGRGAIGSACSCSSHPSNVISLGLCGTEAASASFPCLGFSQSYPLLELLLAILMKGNKAGGTFIAILVTSFPF